MYQLKAPFSLDGHIYTTCNPYHLLHHCLDELYIYLIFFSKLLELRPTHQKSARCYHIHLQ